MTPWALLLLASAVGRIVPDPQLPDPSPNPPPPPDPPPDRDPKNTHPVFDSHLWHRYRATQLDVELDQRAWEAMVDAQKADQRRLEDERIAQEETAFAQMASMGHALEAACVTQGRWAKREAEKTAKKEARRERLKNKGV